MDTPDAEPLRTPVDWRRAGRAGRGVRLVAAAAVSLALVGGAFAPVAVAADPPPPVAVASSLRFAWPTLLDAMDPPPRTRTTLGASLTLAGQILEGAPFELLVAADTDSIGRLVRGGRVAPEDVVRYADGALVLAVRPGSPLAPESTLEALATLLSGTPAARVAVANPVHAPYGRAALEALASAGLEELSPSRVARGESAAQALQYLLAGAVEAALVPRSLAVGAPSGTDIVTGAIDPTSHAPIEHALGIVGGAGPAARALGRHLGGCAARAVLEAEGFSAPRDVARTEDASSEPSSDSR